MLPVLFCSHPFEYHLPHPMFEEEVKIASDLGEVFLLDHSALVEGRTQAALRKVPHSTKKYQTEIVYNGWMVTPDIYRTLYDALILKGYRLVNTPAAYAGCHHLANWYEHIADHTPKSLIVKSSDLRTLIEAAASFGDEPLIIKDFVSSQKHSWKEACFIEKANDAVGAGKVIAAFLALQAEVDGVQGGVVLRQFQQLKSIGTHPKSGMPLSQEFRAFVFNGKIISLSKYWEYGEYTQDHPPKSLFDTIIKKIQAATESRLFTIDVAQKTNREWVCIEVGDGQVSSLPEKADKKKFYQKLS